MPKSDLIEMNGIITDAMGGGWYKISSESGTEIKARLSGRMRMHKVRVLPGDDVKIAVSPYDMSNGMIVFRGKPKR